MKTQAKAPRAPAGKKRANPADSSTRPGKKPKISIPSPITQLPPRVLGRIFTSFLNLHATVPLKRGALLTFAKVHRAWRDLTYSSPHLWATIHIRVDEKHPKVDALTVSTWLKRSCSAPLRVYIVNCAGKKGIWDVNEAISLLAPHFSRLQSLTCQLYKTDTQRVLNASGPSGFPILKQLVLNQPPEPRSCDYSDTPLSLTLSLFPKLSFIQSDYSSDFKFVVKKKDPVYALEVVAGDFHTSLADCLHIIQNSPSLRQLHAKCLDSAPFKKSKTPFTHRTLTNLDVTFDDADTSISHFVDSLTLPSLKYFELTFRESEEEFEWSKCLPQFLERSSPPLYRLHVDGCDTHLMLDCLKLVPKLRELTSPMEGRWCSSLLTCRRPPSDPSTVLNRASHLEHISLRYPEGCTWTPRSALMEMILSRWGGPSGYYPKEGRLRSIELRMLDVDDDDYEELMEGLEECMEEGLEVSMTSMEEY